MEGQLRQGMFALENCFRADNWRARVQEERRRDARLRDASHTPPYQFNDVPYIRYACGAVGGVGLACARQVRQCTFASEPQNAARINASDQFYVEP